MTSATELSLKQFQLAEEFVNFDTKVERNNRFIYTRKQLREAHIALGDRKTSPSFMRPRTSSVRLSRNMYDMSVYTLSGDALTEIKAQVTANDLRNKRYLTFTKIADMSSDATGAKKVKEVGAMEAPPEHPDPLSETDQTSSIEKFGGIYHTADVQAAIAGRDPFEVDPAVVERGVRGHAITQEALAQHLRSIGIEPRSPMRDQPDFDIGWEAGNNWFVGEVKSLTDKNEEKQLRLGLGQVLRYAHQIGMNTTPVLVAERCPTDSSWGQLCEQLHVIFVWPEVFAERIARAFLVAATPKG
jgi:hypothetical protein